MTVKSHKLFGVPVRSVQGEGGTAHRNILGSFRFRRTVPDPTSAMGDYGLAGPDVHRASGVLNSQQTFQHDRILVEVGRLSGLNPAAWAAHVRDAQGLGCGIHPPHIFVDQLWLGACGRDPCGAFYQDRR
ncbi:MAG: hypothetical protein QOJ99_3078 [Bryobacterales bacterium]|nr:hypothetical protein [Bryobacterales bacterium]